MNVNFSRWGRSVGRFGRRFLFAALVAAIFWGLDSNSMAQEARRPLPDTAGIRQALELIGLHFTENEILQMQKGIAESREQFGQIRDTMIPNAWSPALVFNPLPVDFRMPAFGRKPEWPLPRWLERPKDDADIAFMTLPELAHLIRTRQISSVELTTLYINRLKQYNDSLLCIVNLTEDLAMDQARQADRELASGRYRGLLHGIPYGIKDLMAVKGYPTTWGARPYKDQVLDENAHVVEKLTQAGAVLVAKLSTGALAMGDLWFGGTTKNPWNLKRGSSGSSAGPASATAAGLVAFAIGTETLGSIVSPATRCGVTGLRPTYGRVGRSGTMALTWSMDKIGPICRSALDCAIVLDAIRGIDPDDPGTADPGFSFMPLKDLSKLRIGYLKDLFNEDYPNHKADSITLDVFRSLGAKPEPVSLPGGFPVSAMRIILSAEAAAAFDDLTRSNRDSLLDGQKDWDWPNTFREARLIPAVEYIQANRLRTRLIYEVNKVMKDYDLIICPTFGGDQLTMTNLTGHPCLLLPEGFDINGNPISITLLANLYREDLLCEAGHLYQEKTGYYRKRPPKFSK